MGQSFGGEISAADGAFHGGGPAGSGPISGEKNAGPGSYCDGTVGVDSRARRIGGVEFFNDRGFYEIGFARGGEEFTDFTEGEIDDLGAGFVDERLRGAHHELDVATGCASASLRANWLQAGLVKHPLNGAVEEGGGIEIGNLTVEPQVNAGDGRGFEVAEFLANRCALRSLGKDAVEVIERQRE